MSEKNELDSSVDVIIRQIARDVLGINSLETQNSDSFDFHDVSVWQIKSALENAFKVGFESGVNFKGK